MTIEARSTSSRTNAAAYGLQSAAILGPLCALLYYSTASLELALRPPGASVAMLSPQSALLVAFLWAIPGRSWGIVALAMPPAHLLAYMGSGPWWQLAWQIAQILLLAIGISSTLHLLLGQRAPLERLPDFLLYVAIAVVAGPLLLSGFEPGVALALWSLDMAGAAAHWRDDALAGSLAMLTWTPCIYIGFQRISRGRQRTPISAGVAGISVAVAVVATLLAAAWHASRTDLQIFLWLMAFTALVVAIAVEEQRRSSRAIGEYLLTLRQRDERIALLARAVHERIYDWDILRGEVWSSEGNECDNSTPLVRECSLESWGRCIFAGDRERVARECRRTLRGSATKWETEYRQSLRGSPAHWVHHRAFILRDAAGVATRMIGAVADISDRRKLAEANRTLARFANLAMLGQNTVSIAHEMNQPLGAIGYNAEAGLIYLAREHYDPSTFREIFDDICRDNRRASELIDRMREMLQVDELRLDRLDVNDVISDAVGLMRTESRRRRTRLITQLDQVPAVLGDQGGLRQVLLNLIANGMDAMDTVPEQQRQITILTSRVDAARIQVQVVDRGSGIDPEDCAKIFDSFFTSKDHGMGLGLAIARTIVEAHGGRIWAENNADGVGATLAFEISCSIDSARRMSVPSPATGCGAPLN